MQQIPSCASNSCACLVNTCRILVLMMLSQDQAAISQCQTCSDCSLHYLVGLLLSMMPLGLDSGQPSVFPAVHGMLSQLLVPEGCGSSCLVALEQAPLLPDFQGVPHCLSAVPSPVNTSFHCSMHNWFEVKAETRFVGTHAASRAPCRLQGEAFSSAAPCLQQAQHDCVRALFVAARYRRTIEQVQPRMTLTFM